MATLSEVFGIQAKVPTHTYVDRANLDARFKLLLKSDQHIVIHGISKQGKTVLRRRWLSEQESVAVSCVSKTTLNDLMQEILYRLHAPGPTTVTLSSTNSRKRSGELSLTSGVAGTGVKATARLGASDTNSNTETVREEMIGIEITNLGYVIDRVKESQKRIILEDFHYLPENAKQELAFTLKAFYDAEVFFIVVGIWQEQNLLTLYNGDLKGRVEEIDVEWTVPELEQVLEKGCSVLNIFIPDDIAQQMVLDANKNVGMLQRIAKEFCFASHISQTLHSKSRLSDVNALEKCRKQICEELAGRFNGFCDAIEHGFSSKKSDVPKIYQHVIRECIRFSSADQLKGIHRTVIRARVRASHGDQAGDAVFAALKKINRLQGKLKITPLIFSYNSHSKLLQLVDRDLLFYKSYKSDPWPWETRENKTVNPRPTQLISRPFPTVSELRPLVLRRVRDGVPNLRRFLVSTFGFTLEHADSIIREILGRDGPGYSFEMRRRK